MNQAETFAKSPKSPKCLGGNLGDFGDFAKVSKCLLLRLAFCSRKNIY